jgi:two-component system LytT family response regulator
MYRAVIIDDEADCRSSLQMLINRYTTGIEIIGEADSVQHGIKLIQETSPDLVFLDVELPDGSGFDILEACLPVHFQVIFVTAHNEFAIRAFRFSALDYILKPADPDLLNAAVKKLFSLEQTSKTNQQVETFVENRKSLKKIVLPSRNGYLALDVENIVRCEASSNYTLFFLKSKEKIMVSRTLKEFDEMLSPSGFFRIHQSHLVNMDCIVEYRRDDGGQVIMSDGSELEVSRRKKEEFLHAFLK